MGVVGVVFVFGLVKPWWPEEPRWSPTSRIFPREPEGFDSSAFLGSMSGRLILISFVVLGVGYVKYYVAASRKMGNWFWV